MEETLDELMTSLRDGATVVTATRRYARWLVLRYAESCHAAGEGAWQRPDAIPWDAWLRRFWDDLLAEQPGDLPLLLDGTQELAIWQDIIEKDAAAGSLLQTRGAAKSAREAWALCRNWGVDATGPADAENEDLAAFMRWSRVFHSRLREKGWVEQATLPTVLAEHPLPLKTKQILLAGFDELSPTQNGFVDALGARGLTVRRVPFPRRPSSVRRMSFPDAKAEIRTVAGWTRAVLEREPNARIGIVAADLQTIRERLANALRDTLNPAELLSPAGSGASTVNVSLGTALAMEPVVRDALIALGLLAGEESLADWSVLLRSPFFAAGDDEALQRAELDADLRMLGEPEFSVARMLALLEQTDAEELPTPRCARLAASLTGCLERLARLPANASFKAWLQVLGELLQTMGWPGSRPLNSREYQAIASFQDLLRRLAALDTVQRPGSFRGIVASVKQASGDEVFQPGDGEDAPVQVLGTLEAAGLTFDYLWVCGLNDDVWPAPARPHPLLPIGVQRKLGMPHASAVRELRFADAVTDRLLASAEEVVVSCALTDADRPLRPSPLIAHFAPEADSPCDPGANENWNQYSAVANVDPITDESARPLEDNAAVRGGSALLTDQAACPFRAYARHRLNARPLEAPRIGLDARERGALLHAAMERFWGEVKSWQTLTGMTEPQTASVVRDVVSAVVSETARRRRRVFGERYVRMEEQRLEELVGEWLAQERRRAPFEVIATERRATVAFAGLTLRTRIDRVDRLIDGRDLIIDYKTGHQSVAAWMGERPDDAQLPLYGVTYPGELAGVYFAQVMAGDCAFVGVGDDDAAVPGTKAPRRLVPSGGDADWSDLQGQWVSVLTRLAEEFRRGDARAEPKKGGATCRYCGLESLCRIREHDALWDTDDEGRM